MENVRKSKEYESKSERKLLQSDEHVKFLKSKNAELERYRVLCEQRILELYPGHQLPVQEEHLGMNVPYLLEIQMYKQRISRLEQQLFDNNFAGNISNDEQTLEKITKEKLLLEECLRTEVLNCEEQRAYIEILKQALEVNDKIPISGRREKRREDKDSNFDVKRENANLKNTNKDLVSQVENLNNELNEKNKKIEEAFKEIESFRNNAKLMGDKISKYKIEVAKLEEEKQNLVEYMDEHSNKETELEAEINELTKIFDEMKGSYSDTLKMFHEESLKNKNLSNQIEKLQNDLEKSLRVVKSAQNSCDDLKAKLSKTKGELQRAKEEKQNLEIKLENLLLNNATLSETLKETQDEAEKFRNSSEKKGKIVEDLGLTVITIKKDLIEKEKKISSLDLNISNFEKENLAKIEEKNDILKELAKEKQKNSMIQKQLEDIKEKHVSVEEKVQDALIKEVQFSASEETEIRILKNSVLDLQERNRALAENCENLQRDHNEIIKDRNTKSEELAKLTEKNNVLLQELEDYEQVISDNKILQSLLKHEKQALESFNSNSTNELARQLICQQEKEFSLNKQINFLQIRIKEQENLNLFLQENLRELKFKFDDQEIIQSELKSLLSSSTETILSHLSLSKRYNHSMLSPFIQEMLRTFELTSSPEIYDILKFSSLAAEHLRFIFDINSSLQEEINNKNFEVALSSNRIEALTNEIEGYTTNITVLSSQLETLSRENLSLRAEFQTLSHENFDLKADSNKRIAHLKHITVQVEQLESSLKALELEKKVLKTEKTQLEMLLNTCRIELKENSGVENELEALERDRLNIQYQLLKFQGDPKSRNGAMFKDLGTKLKICENEILCYHKSLTPVRGRRETPMNSNFIYPENLGISRLRRDISQSYRERTNCY